MPLMSAAHPQTGANSVSTTASSSVRRNAALTRSIGPYSRPAALAKWDGRTKEARILRETREALTEHVGGAPSAVQRRLIERAAVLTLRVAQLDAKAADAGAMTEHDTRTYLAWSNTLTRTLRELGLKGAAERPPSLAEIMARPIPGDAA